MNKPATQKRNESEKALSTKGQKRISAILKTARKVLTENGLEDFSVNKVAAEAGISIGNLQYYFPKRKDLLYAVLNNMLDPAVERVEKTIFSQREGRKDKQVLRDIVTYGLTSNLSDNGCAITWNFSAMSLYDDDAKAMLTNWYAAYRELLGKALKYYNPKLTKRQLESYTLFIASLIEGHSLIWRHTISDGREFQKVNRDFVSKIIKLIDS